MASLANIFTLQKALNKIFFGHKMFICELIFKISAALFKTFRMQKDDKIILVSGCFEDGDMQ